MAQLTPQFFQTILKIEGGYQAHPSDNGNYCGGVNAGTKYGMSAVAVGSWWGRCPTAQEMQALTQQDAYSFYSWYFDRYNLYRVENQQLFELLANNTMGSPANAAKVEQRALNKLGYSVAVDGQRGPQTIQAINDAWRRYGTEFYNMVRLDWVAYLKSLNRPEFIDGWLYRMNRYFPPLSVSAGVGVGIIALVGLLLLLKKRA